MHWLILFIYVIICYGIANTIIYAHGPFHCFDKMHKNPYKKIEYTIIITMENNIIAKEIMQ